MWLGVAPHEMCRKHLLGEHVELHMLAGCIEKGKSIQGFLDKRLIDPPLMGMRHDAIVEEMKARGYRHATPLEWNNDFLGHGLSEGQYYEAVDRNRADLAARCPECRERMKANALTPVD